MSINIVAKGLIVVTIYNDFRQTTETTNGAEYVLSVYSLLLNKTNMRSNAWRWQRRSANRWLPFLGILPSSSLRPGLALANRERGASWEGYRLQCTYPTTPPTPSYNEGRLGTRQEYCQKQSNPRSGRLQSGFESNNCIMKQHLKKALQAMGFSYSFIFPTTKSKR